MLILTRKLEQGIIIDGQVVVRVLAVEGERIKIGIEAPRTISVLREELLQEVAGQNRAAADTLKSHMRAAATRVPPAGGARPFLALVTP